MKKRKSAENFAKVLAETNNHTRMFELRGHMPVEMFSMQSGRNFLNYGFERGEMPSIVPMSSMAADMLEQGREQIEQMGFQVNTESNAAEIPFLQFPNGINGTPQKGTRKIYPNDPCPCGSGKKYKKCCGRKN